MLGLGGAAQAADQTYQFDIPPESLGQALTDFSRASSQQIVFSEEVTSGRTTKGVHGRYTAGEALSALLAGTDLHVETNSAGVMMVRPKKAEAASTEGGGEPTETVVVTGSRIPTQIGDSTHDVRVYNRDDIDKTGQNTVSDFLNTLPTVSQASTDNVFQAYVNQGSTVRLRGLPVGTTLVLLDGRRLETSGTQADTDFFDLGNIPLAAVDRVEIVGDGSSAIYGSDAIAGVVNVILRKDFDGLSASSQVGHANGSDTTNSSVAFGQEWARGGFSVIASYDTRSTLLSSQRALTASNDYTRYGGGNANLPVCQKANIYSADGVSPLPGAPAGSGATFAATAGVPGGGAANFSDFDYGTLNECNVSGQYSVLPATQRFGLLSQGHYQLTPSVELFTEALYSHVNLFEAYGSNLVFGEPGYTPITVGASNPYNPFGETVGVSGALPDAPVELSQNTNFYRVVAGARGTVGDWNWELSAWNSADNTTTLNRNADLHTDVLQSLLNSSDPSLALNPFSGSAWGSQNQVKSVLSNELIRFASGEFAFSGFARGSLFRLPAGDVQVVVGGEFDHDVMSDFIVETLTPPSSVFSKYSRDQYAVFGETSIPILDGTGDLATLGSLKVSLAGRYDQSSHVSGKPTVEIGSVWQPLKEFVVRGTYATAFKAPSLKSLYAPQTSSLYLLFDPVQNQSVQVPVIFGGNTHLRPLTGISRTLGLVYTSESVPGLTASITDWAVEERNLIQSQNPQVIVTNEENFPGRVVRDSTGRITEINATTVNFGSLRVSGLDYDIGYRHPVGSGVLSTSVAATQIYTYEAAITPGAVPVDGLGRAQNTGDWAPTWKTTVTVGYDLDFLSASVDGRYVDSYRDYSSTRSIGNFWLFDGSLRFQLGTLLDSDDKRLSGSTLTIGGVNLLNTLPQYSDYDYNYVGYDPTQADIRGRYVYVRLGTAL